MQYRGFALRPVAGVFKVTPLEDDGSLQRPAGWANGEKVYVTEPDGSPTFVNMWTGDEPLTSLTDARRWVDDFLTVYN